MTPYSGLSRPRPSAASDAGIRRADAVKDNAGPADGDASAIERAARAMTRGIAKKNTKEKTMQHVATEQDLDDRAMGRLRHSPGQPSAQAAPVPAPSPVQDTRAPAKPGSMAVDAAVHEALFRAGPKIIVAAA